MTLTKVLAGVPCTFDLQRRKRQKRLIVTPIGSHHYRVTAPRRMSQKTVEEALETHAKSILALKPTVLPLKRMVAAERVFIFGTPHRLEVVPKAPMLLADGVLRLPSRSAAAIDIEHALSKQLESWLKEYVETLLLKHQAVLTQFGAATPVFQYRTMKTKFGSCRPTQGRITLNLELVHYPKSMIEYIFLHEITHLKHPDHSAHFYATLASLCPDHRAHKKTLDTLRRTLLHEPLEQVVPLASLMSESSIARRLS